MNKAFIRQHQLSVAGKWNELSREQLVRLMQIFQRPDLTHEVAETRLVALLLQLWKRPHMARLMLQMPLEEVATLRLLTRSFLAQPVQLTRQLLPTLPGSRLHGPGDNLAGITFDEWIQAENAYFQYRDKKHPQQLVRLVATLYRPRARQLKRNGDKREPFNAYTLDTRAEQLATLDQAVAQAVLYYYDSCRAHIITHYPELFPGKEYDDDPDPVPKNPTRNYLLMLRELAGTPDRFELIGQQDANNVFFHLNERIAEANRQADELEKRRNG